jgi:hypothetical protein
MASKTKNIALIEQAKTFKNVPWCEDYEKMVSGMLYVTRVHSEFVQTYLRIPPGTTVWPQSLKRGDIVPEGW